jgi:hypothetical protein
MPDSKKILTTEVTELIYLSVSLSDKQKSAIVSNLKTMSYKQISQCKDLFKREQKEVSKILRQKFSEGLHNLKNYDAKMNHDTQDIFKNAEKNNAYDENPDGILKKLKDIDD